MGSVVPGKGDAFAMDIATNTPVVTALGPFPEGTFIERLRVVVYAPIDPATTGIRLGFGISASPAESFENWEVSSKIWRPRLTTGARWPYFRLQMVTGLVLAFDVDVGVPIMEGSRYVLVYHDLEDGTEYHVLFVSVRAREIVGAVKGVGLAGS